MRDLHKEFVNRKIKKPNKLLTKFVCFVFLKISKKRNVEFVYDEEYLKELERVNEMTLEEFDALFEEICSVPIEERYRGLLND